MLNEQDHPGPRRHRLRSNHGGTNYERIEDADAKGYAVGINDADGSRHAASTKISPSINVHIWALSAHD